jgi:putative aminopeptidase FrvX
LGPEAIDAPIEINADPTVWATDSYSVMTAADGALVADTAAKAKIDVQFQALSRGGSDASCGASHGLCARPITLGLPMKNSHGYEVIHQGAMENLAKLTVALVQALSSKG